MLRIGLQERRQGDLQACHYLQKCEDSVAGPIDVRTPASDAMCLPALAFSGSSASARNAFNRFLLASASSMLQGLQCSCCVSMHEPRPGKLNLKSLRREDATDAETGTHIQCTGMAVCIMSWRSEKRTYHSAEIRPGQHASQIQSVSRLSATITGRRQALQADMPKLARKDMEELAGPAEDGRPVWSPKCTLD
jgi:hypothetical protein